MRQHVIIAGKTSKPQLGTVKATTCKKQILQDHGSYFQYRIFTCLGAERK